MATIGHNNPPDPFTAIEAHVSDLITEAKNWADGSAIENQAQADAVAKLIDDFRAASKAADDARKEEAKPFDDGKAEVQAKYAVLLAETKAQTGSIPRALTALKATLTPWLQHLERERQAAAKAAQDEADKQAREAAEKLRATSMADMAGREEAEAIVAAAQAVQDSADALAKARSHAKGDGRAIGLRTTYRPVLTDPRAAVLHYMTDQREAFLDLVQKLAEVDVRNGKRQLPGFDVVAETKV
jgi:hypothetical protein